VVWPGKPDWKKKPNVSAAKNSASRLAGPKTGSRNPVLGGSMKLKSIKTTWSARDGIGSASSQSETMSAPMALARDWNIGASLSMPGKRQADPFRRYRKENGLRRIA
jgi:hypothetical protein